MRLTGEFTTAATPDALSRLMVDPGRLAGVDGLSQVEPAEADVLHAVFSPLTSLGRIPLRTVITRVSGDDEGASLHVVGSRGPQSIDVDLQLDFTTGSAGTRVAWVAEVVARGSVASVGQRVWADVATRAIGDVLAGAADVA